MSWFPILIEMQDTKEQLRCESPDEIPKGRTFKVLRTRVE